MSPAGRNSASDRFRSRPNSDRALTVNPRNLKVNLKVMHNVLTVSELTDQLTNCLEARFPFVWVRGEITNWSRAASGHIYFTLKDMRAQLQCVWFASRQKRASNFDPLTGEVYDNPCQDPCAIFQNGLEILCAGSLGVYAQRGQYQLLVEFAQAAGEGLLALEFEKCKARLAAMGYFDQSVKKAIPLNPERVALITSAHGAAVHDFMELASGRGLSARIRLFNVPVQGRDAAARIAHAIDFANLQNWAQVIVVIRGGGSLEDLWAFNEEPVAKAIYESRLPVLTGIGHEIDTSIADLTADLRAATPSHAAQLLWPLRREIWQRLDEGVLNVQRVIDARLQSLGRTVSHLERMLRLVSPGEKIRSAEKRFQDLARKLGSVNSLEARKTRLNTLIKILSRKELEQRKILPGLQKCQLLERSLRMAELKHIERNAAALEYLERTALERVSGKTGILEHRLRGLARALETLNPDAPLQKGFALLYDQGRIIRSIAGIKTGDTIDARLKDGSLVLKVKAIRIQEKKDAED